MSLRKLFSVQLLFLSIIIIAGLLLQPRIARSLIPPLRERSLSTFIQSIEMNHTLQRQDLWQFRDTYSFGHFTIDNAKQTSFTDYFSSLPMKPQLAYSSPFIQSMGGQVTLTSLKELGPVKGVTQPLVETSTLRLYKLSPDNYLLLTLNSLDEEKRANGFFDKMQVYEGMEYWLEVNKITH